VYRFEILIEAEEYDSVEHAKDEIAKELFEISTRLSMMNLPETYAYVHEKVFSDTDVRIGFWEFEKIDE